MTVTWHTEAKMNGIFQFNLKFMYEDHCVSIQISLKFVPPSPINNENIESNNSLLLIRQQAII